MSERYDFEIIFNTKIGAAGVSAAKTGVVDFGLLDYLLPVAVAVIVY